MVKKLRIVIDNEAKKSLRKAYEYIKKDSLSNAEKVRQKILSSIKVLARNPGQHGLDKYRKDNDALLEPTYEVYKYRITYHLGEDEIHIIRIRHTKMNPLEY